MNQSDLWMLKYYTDSAVFINASGFLVIVLLVILCHISLYKDDKIHSPKLFRFSIIVFVIALFAPLLTSALFQSLEPAPRSSDDRFVEWAALLHSLFQPTLLAVSIAMLLFSIMPQHTVIQTIETESRPHPLDD